MEYYQPSEDHNKERKNIYGGVEELPNESLSFNKNNSIPKLNPDEIILDMEDSEFENTVLNSQSDIQCEEPSKKNSISKTSFLSPTKIKEESETLEIQRRVDALLASIGSTPLTDISERNFVPDSYPSLQIETLNDKTHQSQFSSWSLSDVKNRREDFQYTGRKKIFNEFWYLDYYDPSFNEDPWGKIKIAEDII
ncbi:hypothetical protein HI914_03081 [Erysiphe necator]|nr:hypothetical protein HI914_03081 [Erysiphe necator]